MVRSAAAPARAARLTLPIALLRMSSDARPKTGSDDTIQFDRSASPFYTADPGSSAAPEAPTAVACEQCQAPITLAYFEANGRVLCARCKHVVEQAAGGGDSSRTGRLTRATLFGLAGGLIGGAVWFTIAVMFNIELGLVAILVGYLVGQGVQKGASGRSGRRYQVLAVALTYLAISGSYAAMFARGVAAEAAAEATTDSTGRAASATSAAAEGDEDVSASDASAAAELPGDAVAMDGTIIERTAADSVSGGVESVGAPIAVVLGLLFALVLPIAANVMSMPGGLIGLAIIFFALQQAWALNAGTPLVITGPHRLGTPRPPAA